MVVNQLKVHPFQISGFRYVNLHPYIGVSNFNEAHLGKAVQVDISLTPC